MRNLFSTRVTETMLGLAMLLLRVGIGSIMMINHGLDKLKTFSQKSAIFPDPFGLGHSTSLSLVVFAEFFCSAFIILGLFTRLAAIPLIIAMGVALFITHHGQMFGDGENAAVYLIIYIVLFLIGPGRFSLDKFIGKG